MKTRFSSCMHKLFFGWSMLLWMDDFGKQIFKNWVVFLESKMWCFSKVNCVTNRPKIVL